jgi:transcriptional regulator with XRE-family HTH domain
MSPKKDISAAGELLGARLRELRVGRGLSQQALADRVGMPQTHVSAIEVGARLPNLTTVLRLTIALDCKVMDLVGVFDETNLPSIVPR